MSRNGHYRAGTVTHHYIVRDINRYFPSAQRINGCKTFDFNAGFILYKLGALKLGLFGAFIAVVGYIAEIGYFILILIDNRMLRSYNHKGDAEKGVGTGRIYAELFAEAFKLKVDKGAGGFADPVDLLLLYVGKIIYLA